jgi:hypothetical protein
MEDQGEKWGLLFIFPHWVQWPVELKVCSRSDMQFCTFPSSMAPAGQQCREMERTKQGSPHMQQEMLKVLMEPWSNASNVGAVVGTAHLGTSLSNTLMEGRRKWMGDKKRASASWKSTGRGTFMQRCQPRGTYLVICCRALSFITDFGLRKFLFCAFSPPVKHKCFPTLLCTRCNYHFNDCVVQVPRVDSPSIHCLQQEPGYLD